MKKIVFLCALGVVLISCSTQPVGPPDSIIAGQDNRVLVDNAGTVHALYNYSLHLSNASDVESRVYYAERPDGGTWSKTQMGSGISSADVYDIDMDSAGGIHLFYALDGIAKHSVKATGSSTWTTEDLTDLIGEIRSAAIDTNNGIHLSLYSIGYDTPPRDRLYYSYRPSGGSWKNYYVKRDASSWLWYEYGRYSDIEITASGTIHIIYSFETTLGDFNLMDAYSNATVTNWTCDEIDASAAGSYCSLAVDKNDVLHVSSYGNGSDALFYMQNNGSWGSRVAVDDPTGGDVGRYTDIEVDNNTDVHILYSDSSNSNIKYAYYISGVGWSNEIVGAGDHGSLAVTTNGTPHVLYYQILPGEIWNSFGELYYAYRNLSGEWIAEVLHSTNTNQ